MVPFAHLLAESINPLFVLLLLAAPFLGPRPPLSRLLIFWGLTALGIALAVVLAEAGKRFVVWPGHPSFPSGHETFALACATSLLCWRFIYVVVALPLVLLIGWALVTAGYHHTPDIFGALITGPGPALLCQAARPRRTRPPASRVG